MKVLVSPTEPKAVFQFLCDKGIQSTIPEMYGADYMLFTNQGRIAIQRKRFPEDFFSSLSDNRVTREITLLHRADYRLWLMEGTPAFTVDGNLLNGDGDYSRWTQRQIRNLLRSMRYQHKIDFEWTVDLRDTANAILELESWFTKSLHRSLLTRTKAGLDDTWKVTDKVTSKRDWARYFLQGFPGMGVGRSEALFDHFGRVPLRWDVTKEELLQVKGLGKKLVDELWGSLEG